MGFLKSFKEKLSGDDHERRDDLNPDGGRNQRNQAPEIDNYDHNTTKREKQQVFGTSEQQYQNEYTAPPGPPPSHQQYSQQPQQPQFYDMNQRQGGNANPPPYQDPQYQEQQAEHPWQSIPDTSEFPPPPALHAEFSPANNASEDSAEAGYTFCAKNPIYMPATPTREQHARINISGDINLQAPQKAFRGKFKKESLSSSHFRSTLSTRTVTRHSLASSYSSGGDGGSKVHRISSAYTITSPPGSTEDVCFTTDLPLYFAQKDNPLLQRSTSTTSNLANCEPKELSFAIRIISIKSDPNATIGIGFVSRPYPPFRQPGWHRGSLGIHADDGRRYINDPDGGIDFVPPFCDGDLIVVTLTVFPEPSPAASTGPSTGNENEVSDLPKCRCRVEFERNGAREGGWDMHEERDAERPGIQGLQGEGDLYAAIGASGGCTFEVLFWPQGPAVA